MGLKLPIPPQQEINPAINELADIENPSTTMNLSVVTTTATPSDLSDHTPLFPYYASDLIPTMIQQSGVK